MSLLPDQWDLLEELGAAHADAPGWLHGGHDEGDGRRRTSAVQTLARERLCEPAPGLYGPRKPARR